MAGAKSYIECAGLPEDLVSLKVLNRMKTSSSTKFHDASAYIKKL
jgi:hypothetical protein